MARVAAQPAGRRPPRAAGPRIPVQGELPGAPARPDRSWLMTTHAAPLTHDQASTRRAVPGWRWVAVGLAFPIAGYLGWAIGGRVDAAAAALIGGAITGAGLGAVQWWAAKGSLGDPAPWIVLSAAGYGVGLAAAAAIVDYDSDIAALAVMGLVSGAVLGATQALALARHG